MPRGVRQESVDESTMMFSRRAMLSAGALGALALAVGSAERRPFLATAADAAAVVHWRRVRDSFAVNVHWGYPDTPYGYAYEQVRDLLVDSGIPHVRGDVFRAQDLVGHGVRTTVLVDKRWDGSGDPAGLVADVARVAGAAEDAVAAVEGPNESDLAWPGLGRTYRGRGFPEGVIAWQADLWAAMKADPRTAGIPVIAPSCGGTYWGRSSPFAAGAFAETADFGNLHVYPAGNAFSTPGPYGGLDRYYWDSDFPSNTLDVWPVNFETYAAPYRGLPWMATEGGYSTYALGQSERVQGVYAPRIFLEFLRLGIQRTYLYEFVDEFDDPSGANREAHFGLVRRDLTPKPAFHAIRSLIGAISRGASDATPVPFSPSITVQPPAGYDAAALHHLVIAQGGRRYLIAMWHEVSANDISGRDMNPPQPPRELAHPPMTVSLDMGMAAGVAAQRMLDSGQLQAQGVVRRGDVIELTVTDHVTLVSVEV